MGVLHRALLSQDGKGCWLTVVIHSLLTFSGVFFFATLSDSTAGGSMPRKDVRNELEQISQSKTWKMLQRNEPEALHLYTLPFFTDRTEVFRLQEPRTQFIGQWHLSPNHKRIAIGVYPHKEGTGEAPLPELYLINMENSNTVTPISGAWRWVASFVGNRQLLLIDHTNHPTLLDLETNKSTLLQTKLGAMGDATATLTGDRLVYDVGDGFVVYDLKRQTNQKLHVDGDDPVLSPDGQHILFRRGGFTGSYYIMDAAGHHETLLLSEQVIHAKLRGSGGYTDLVFLSWSPDGRFILLDEASDLEKGRLFVLKVSTKELVEITFRGHL